MHLPVLACLKLYWISYLGRGIKYSPLYCRARAINPNPQIRKRCTKYYTSGGPWGTRTGTGIGY